MREPVWPEPGAPAPAEKPPLGPMRILPALTPEEWEGVGWNLADHLEESAHWQPGDGLRIWLNNSQSRVYVTLERAGESTVVINGSGARHALAALCLADQPFGFTHEDVRKLRAIGGQILTEEALSAPCTCAQVRMKHGGRVPPEEGFGYGYHYAECNRSRVVQALPFTTVEWAAKLADRIAALLPPEVPNA